jgi:dipeptidyl aminopeptidase/acylaminoacyl peptidase
MKLLSLAAVLLPLTASAQNDAIGNLERAEKFGGAARAMIRGADVRMHWSPGDSHLAWRVDTGRETYGFFLLDLKTGKKIPAFDHAVVAKALGESAGKPVDATCLPVENVEYVDGSTLRFSALGKAWKFSGGKVSADATPPKEGASLWIAPEEAPKGSMRDGEPTSIIVENATGGEIEAFWIADDGERRSYGKVAAGETFSHGTYGGNLWLMTNAKGEPLAAIEAPDVATVAKLTGRVAPVVKEKAQRRRGRAGGGGGSDTSPDGKWRAFVRANNLFIQPVGGGEEIQLSKDGADDKRYGAPIWSPDSQKLVAMFTPQVEERQIHIVEASPADQLQPKLRTLNYAKPGDAISQPKPHLFHVDKPGQVPLDEALFANPWEINDLAWAADSSEFSFVYNQRGHQVMRMVGINAATGAARAIHEDTTTTFIDYSQKSFMRRLGDGSEVLWASERDGYNHLYLIDAVKGTIKNQITKGPWNVREVLDINEKDRTLLLRVIGLPGQDPYHMHFARVNFDGTGFTRLTDSDGSHQIEFSPTREFFVATWSRVDQPPVMEVRRSGDGKLVAEIGRADDAELRQTGWSRPERFVAKGRDGATDIYGVIIRPINFDPAKSYPVVEDIYAGPHDFFVPKKFSPWMGMNNIAELGFVVVKIDGMGTNWRSKAFHDVAWKNLADSGFPDRIAWMKAAATTRPFMDLTRVGILGGSAGGQSTLAGLLHHADFYKVGVADCGCHDNRMDKIWWNEAWMGWPIDESYERNSNVTHAAKLQGKLMLVVGELDNNVDPATTAQVVYALQKANKDFDFLPVMNTGHGACETPYGKRRRASFLTRHLLGQE